MHDNELYVLARRGRGVDAKRSRGYRGEGLIGDGEVAHRLDYRILDAGGREIGSFRLWTVDPADAEGAGASDAPVLPLAFEFRPRQYLELKARRNPPPAVPGPDALVLASGQ